MSHAKRSGALVGRTRPGGSAPRRPAARRCAVLPWLLLALVVGAAKAQPWTIQTVAFRDLRDATAAATSLNALGLDAYTEFSMHQGRQYVRVRVGCFRDRPAADAVADLLRGRVTADAAVAPITATAPVAGCLEQDVGFLKPGRWSIEPGAARVPSFDVEVAGHSARILHTGVRWALFQEGDPLPDASQLPVGSFAQGSLGGVAVVMETVAGRSLVLCPGTLLATVGEVAVVDQELSVVACRLAPGAPGRTAATP